MPDALEVTKACHRCHVCALRTLFFCRVQAHHKTEYSDLLMEAGFRHKPKGSDFITYLENRILNKNELNILKENIKTSEAIQEIVWKKQTN